MAGRRKPFLTQAGHADLLEFADRLKQKSYSIRLINRVMLPISYYFNWLGQSGQAAFNHAAGIILKGRSGMFPTTW